MINRTFSSVAVVIALGIITPIQAYAFGLGKLELSSALNEPFTAKIPVTALREDEEGNLQVRLATSNEFARAGIERSHFLTKLVFNIVEHPGGATIEVSSQQPVREPFIDFLLTATTGEGRLIREYTVLLDPPKTVFVRPPTKATSPSQAKTTTQKSSKKTTYRYPDSGYQAPQTNYYSANSYGPTKRNDTLWDIAVATKPSSAVSVHQMMMALRDKNPDAFIKNNINNLKTGQTLIIPNMDEITKLSNRQAIAAVAEQWQQWKQENNKIVATKAQTESNVAESNDQMLDGEMQTEGSSDARLQLVVDSEDATTSGDKLSPMGSDALTKLRDQLTLAQETIEGQEQENVDFKARMDAMEEQLEIMRRIIMVKDADLARLQGALGDDQQIALESDNLPEEMQKTLEETDADNSTTDQQLDTDAGIDALVENTNDTMQAQPERIFDKAAAAAAAAAAKAEAEYGGHYLFLGADPVPAVLPEQIDFNTASPMPEDSLQAERMIDKAAVMAAAEAARSEAELEGNKLFSAEELDAPLGEISDSDSVDEINETLDEMNTVPDETDEMISSPEVDVVDEIVVEDTTPLGLVDKIKTIIVENKTAVLGGLGALFLGLLAWLFARRRNQDEEYEWVDTASIEDADDTESASDSTILTDEEQVNSESSEIVLEPEENIDDLLKQAEMSIAYGEFEEAHAVIERAKLQDPTNQGVALKLAALAYHQKQPEEFNKLIADIDIDKDSTEWQEIVAWGKELEPENESQPITEEVELTDDLANTVDVLEPETIEINEESDSELEFNLDESLEENSTEDNSEDEATLTYDTDFDLEENESNSNNDTELDIDAPLSLDIETDDDADFVLNTDSSSVEDPEKLEVEDHVELESDPSDALADITLDEIATETIEEEIPVLTTEKTPVEETEQLDVGADDLEFDIGDFDEVDEAETKLDLAAAYVDMGDPDGAKNILNEVLQEGNDEQQSRAQDLLNNLK